MKPFSVLSIYTSLCKIYELPKGSLATVLDGGWPSDPWNRRRTIDGHLRWKHKTADFKIT